MAKVFQVRYTVGDKTVAHEHYTEKGGIADAKALSKVIGNAQMGEIDVGDDGTKAVVKQWEFTGGEVGKPIKREGIVPSEVEVIKSVEDTRIPEGKAEKKPKAPKLSPEEKIAKIKQDAEEKLAAIAAGTFVLPARGRKASSGTSAPKPRVDRTEKLKTELNCSDKAARILSDTQHNATGRRARITAMIVDANGPILASAIVSALNATGKEDRTVEINDVMSGVRHLNFLLSREDQPWKVIYNKESEDPSLNLVPVRVEILDQPDEDQSNVA
jgi:hypothetical protein